MRKVLPLILLVALAGAGYWLMTGGPDVPGSPSPPSSAAASPEDAPAAARLDGEPAEAPARGDARGALVFRVLDAQGAPVDAALHLLADGEPSRLRAAGGRAQLLPLPQRLSAVAEAEGRWSEAVHWSADEPGNQELVLRLDAEAACALRVAVTIAGEGPAPDARVVALDGMPATGWERMFEGLQLRDPDQERAPAAVAAPAAASARPDADLIARRSLLRETWHADAGGVVAIERLRAGVWSFEVRAEGCPPAYFECELVPGDSAERTVSLERGAVLAGRVLSDDGAPLAGAAVGLWPKLDTELAFFDPSEDFLRYGRLPASIPAELRASTDAEGRYQIGTVPAGDWFVLATAEGLRPAKSAALAVEARERAQAEDLRLRRGHALAVRARDAAGAPVAGAAVRWRAGETVLGMMSEGSEPLLTDDAGRARLAALPSAEVEVAVEHADFARQRNQFVFQAGAEALEQEWDVTLRAGAALRGTVLSSGVPVAGAMVRVVPPREGSSMLAAVFDGEAETRSGEAGDFAFERLPPGSWRLFVEHEDYARLTSENFELLEGENPSRTLHLLAGANVIVTVLDDAGARVEGAVVLAQETADFQTETATSGADGIARLLHLSPGDWRLMRVDGMRDVTPENMDLDLRFVFLTLEEGRSVEVTLGGPVERADVEGRLTMGGQPLARHMIALVGGGGVRTGRSDDDGNYRLEGIEVGGYMVSVASGLGGGSSWYGALQIAASGTLRHDIEVPSSTVEVRVSDATTGEAIAGVPVNLRPEDAHSVSGGTFQTSDADGLARFTMLDPGGYLVAAGSLAMPLLGGGDAHGSVLVPGIVVASADAGLQRVEARLPAPARLRVRVTGPDGGYLAGAHVHCLGADGQALNFFSTKGSNAKGVVELSGLPPGTQRFLARHPQIGSAEFVLTLQAGELAKHEVAIGAGVMLEVSVTDAKGARMSGVLAVAMEPDGRPLFYFTTEESQAVNQSFFSGSPQRVGPLAPGRYLIRLHRPGFASVEHAVTVAPTPAVQSLSLRFAPPE